MDREPIFDCLGVSAAYHARRLRGQYPAFADQYDWFLGVYERYSPGRHYYRLTGSCKDSSGVSGAKHSLRRLVLFGICITNCGVVNYLLARTRLVRSMQREHPSAREGPRLTSLNLRIITPVGKIGRSWAEPYPSDPETLYSTSSFALSGNPSALLATPIQEPNDIKHRFACGFVVG